MNSILDYAVLSFSEHAAIYPRQEVVDTFQLSDGAVAFTTRFVYEPEVVDQPGGYIGGLADLPFDEWMFIA